jgi:molybdopterin/thiamine biosynthesis adenylyltransferase/rhodanese-related sulfurtransferase
MDNLTPNLSQDEILRYSRHLMIPEVGLEGQRKLKDASVLVVGTGGLGSPVTLYLAAAGIGRIGLVDFDVVDSSNLQRQVLYGTSALGQRKVEAARARLLDLNPYIQVDSLPNLITAESARSIAEGYAILVDCSDNFPTRYLVNDLCVLTGRPDVYGSVFRFEGQISVFDARSGPCYRCLFPNPPPPGLTPTCANGGVFGMLPGTIGTLQAAEVIKLILGVGVPLIGKLLLYDALDQSLQPIKLKKNPHCTICGESPNVTGLVDYEEFCGESADGLSHVVLPAELSITPSALTERLQRGDRLILLDVREPVEQQVSRLEGAFNIPLGLLASRLGELERGVEIVAFCRTGTRSSYAVQMLAAAGFVNVKSLQGGLNAWAEQVEPGMLKY